MGGHPGDGGRVLCAFGFAPADSPAAVASDGQLEGSMKQNERWLVYAVTGFLALVLVFAVLSSRPAENTGDTKKLQGLNEIINPGADKKTTEVGKADATMPPNPAGVGVGVPDPNQVAPQPLNAQPKAIVASDVVTQAYGPSEREFGFRRVWVKQNDSLETLVRRWCGVDRTQAEDVRRLVDETKKLNEDLATLKTGTRILLPWVDDEVLVAAIEAQKPKVLVADASATGQGALATPIPGILDGTAARPTDTAGSSTLGSSLGNPSPTFATPGGGAATPNGDNGVRALTAGGTKYTVKKGDALWSIADRTYGRKNADRMVAAIKAANPGLGDQVRAGQSIVLPKDEKATAGQ
jgi:phage tail protein X